MEKKSHKSEIFPKILVKNKSLSETILFKRLKKIFFYIKKFRVPMKQTGKKWLEVFKSCILYFLPF